jgi:AcrR family transcriptional regulator
LEDLAARSEPQQPRALARREAILDAAMDLLADFEVADISTTSIALRANIPVGSVYRYFPNKFAILSELARRWLDRDDARLEALIREAIASGEAVDDDGLILAAVDLALDVGAREPGPRRLIQAIGNLPELRPLLRASNLRVMPIIALAVRRTRPDLSDARVEAIVRTAVEAYTQIGNRAVESGDSPLFPLLVEEWKRLLLAYFRSVREEAPGG